MRKLIAALLIAVAAAGCTAPPPPFEHEDMGPDRGTPEHDAACRTHPEVNDCP